MNLFAAEEEANRVRAQPLAARLRPRTLQEFVGQTHLLGPTTLLTRLLRADRLGSWLLFGPPGTGKTTLARLLAQETCRQFVELSAILHGVKELREVLMAARERVTTTGRGTLLFIDEIHRFNRAQQDALLADVEQGVVTLVGATTSNPFFAVNPALVSRSQLGELRPLSAEEMLVLLRRGLTDSERGLGLSATACEAGALERLAELANGDARQALSLLEIVALASPSPGRITCQGVDEAVVYRGQRYDATGDEHYDCASALIKSIRGSDPDAAIYWLARMLEGGEDLRFLARRLVIAASEDIGNADPAALPLAVATFQTVEQVGWPECQFALAQAALYLAMAPKSNSATAAINAARRDVQQQAILPVPRHLRDAHYAGAAELGNGAGYQYAHDAPEGVVAQDYLGVEREYYHPVPRGWEATAQSRLEQLRAHLRGVPPQSLAPPPSP